MHLQVYRARVKTFRSDVDSSKRQITKVKSFGRPTSAREELFSKGEQVMAPACAVAACGQDLTYLTAYSAGRGWSATATPA
jgi:hypothetical protein